MAPRTKDWWLHQLKWSCSTSIPRSPDPIGMSSTMHEECRSLDLAAVKKDLAALMTDYAEWCRRIWALRRIVHPHGVAQRRQVSQRRWARRWRTRGNSDLRR